MRRQTALLLILLGSCLMLLPISQASASDATYGEVWTHDADGNEKIEFDDGETVYISWNANGDVDITVIAPDGTTVDKSWTGLGASGTVDFIPENNEGIYEVKCTGAESKLISYGTFFVIPESPIFGTLGVAMVAFASLAIKRKLEG